MTETDTRFDEIWDELENLAGGLQSQRAQADAMQKVFLALLRALDDKMPVAREMIVMELDEACDRACSTDNDSPECHALAELTSAIQVDNMLIRE